MSGWDCTCGLHNKVFSNQCADCGGFRVHADTKRSIRRFSDPWANPDVCQVCGRAPAAHFDFTRNQGWLVFRRRFTHEGRYCRSCATGAYRAIQARNLTEGWYGTISVAATIAYGFENLSHLLRGRKRLNDPMPSDQQMEARLRGLPTIVQMLMRPVFWVALAIIVAIAVPVATVVPDEATASADRAFAQRLVSVNDARNAMISTQNSKEAAWEKGGANQPPTADDLVVKELAALRTAAEALPAPASSELAGLQQVWYTRLAALVSAERNLAAAYNTMTLEADQRAWSEEATAFKSLLSYVNAH
jgi:hypothetical protein